MSTTSRARSAFFDGEVGCSVDPRSFPSCNYIRNARAYECEGDWVFCRFEGPEVYAGRFGFTRGAVDFTDYGASAPNPPSYLQPHIELLTRDGAVLWYGTGMFDGRQMQSASDRVDMTMSGGGKTVFHVAGWPRMTWVMQCPNSDLSLDVALDLEQVIILPDAVLPRMTFSMWMATAAITGTCRIDGRTVGLRGTAFYDHPRINARRNDVGPFGLYHYTPTVLADGSRLISYYSRNRANQWHQDYSFAYWVRPGQPVVPLRSVAMSEMRFDADRLLEQWHLRWEGEGITIEGRSRVTPMPIRRIWGGPGVNLSRHKNPMIPLPFDSDLAITQAGQITRTTGQGFAEFVAHPELATTLIGPE